MSRFPQQSTTGFLFFTFCNLQFLVICSKLHTMYTYCTTTSICNSICWPNDCLVTIKNIDFSSVRHHKKHKPSAYIHDERGFAKPYRTISKMAVLSAERNFIAMFKPIFQVLKAKKKTRYHCYFKFNLLCDWFCGQVKTYKKAVWTTNFLFLQWNVSSRLLFWILQKS